MNSVSVINTLKTMTSREIAELTGKRHDHVMRDARQMLEEIGSAENTANLPDAYGRPQPVLFLSIREALLFLSKSRTTSLQTIDSLIKHCSDIDSIMRALDDFEIPDDIEDMYVYAIRNTVTGNVKLGISRDPEARLNQLQTGNDCALELVATRRADNRFQDEVRIHNKHANVRVLGEWFSSCDIACFKGEK